MLRVRFAPSPTGFLHIGSARTFIFNWLYARRNGGAMILRIDDTDVERNTEQSLQSIFDGLNWLHLSWDEQYRQSERLALHKADRRGDLPARHGVPRFHSRRSRGRREIARGRSLAIQCRDARVDRAKKATAVPPRARNSCCVSASRAKAARPSASPTSVYGDQSKATADIEDFALLRSDGMPTYHLASCADDADLKISHVIRGQDHLSNTFKHILIFEAAGATPPALRASAAAGRSGRRQAL